MKKQLPTGSKLFKIVYLNFNYLDYIITFSAHIVNFYNHRKKRAFWRFFSTKNPAPQNRAGFFVYICIAFIPTGL